VAPSQSRVVWGASDSLRVTESPASRTVTAAEPGLNGLRVGLGVIVCTWSNLNFFSESVRSAEPLSLRVGLRGHRPPLARAAANRRPAGGPGRACRTDSPRRPSLTRRLPGLTRTRIRPGAVLRVFRQPTVTLAARSESESESSLAASVRAAGAAQSDKHARARRRAGGLPRPGAWRAGPSPSPAAVG
jgi:hypothetical protein